MSNIEDDVKAAIGEFGECAFERFIRDRSIVIVGGIGWINLLSNSELEFKTGLKLKPLPELFVHDIKIYDDNAYLMWESLVDTVDDVATIIPESNTDFIEDMEYTDEIRRKTSAARPFDLEGAKAGELFEYFYGNQWYQVKWGDDRFYEFELDDNYSWMLDDGDNLRMKYPKKVQS